MKKFKSWLYGKFLPAWCRDELLSENKELAKAILEQKQEIARLNSYINGLHDAMRSQRRIIINTGEVKRD